MEHLDEDAVRRILARARRDEAGHDSGVEVEALVAAAGEVGYDGDAVRDAVAIERLGPPTPESAALDRVVGAGRIVVERELALDAQAATERAAALLDRSYRMAVRRHPDGRVVARRRRDLRASVVRMIDRDRGHRNVGRLAEVEVVAVPLTPSATGARSLVRVSAVRSGDRRARLTIGGTLGGTGLGVGAVGIAESLIAWPLVAGGLLGAGTVTAVSGRFHAERVDVALDDVVHDLVAEEAPTGAMRRVSDTVRRVVGG